VTFLQPPASLGDTLSLVDGAMYSVKRVGKNSIAFEIHPVAMI
jgi:hypothetical protein